MKDDWTTVEDLLAELPQPDSDAARFERVRSRCHKELSRRSRPPVLEIHSSERRLTPVRRAVETALVGGFCAAYLCALALKALHTRGVL